MNAATTTISKQAGIRRLIAAGKYATYAEADQAGAHEDLSVAGLKCNMTTTARVAEILEA